MCHEQALLKPVRKLHTLRVRRPFPEEEKDIYSQELAGLMTLEVPWDFMRVEKRLRKYSASSFRLLSCFSNPEAALLLLYVNLTLLDFTVALDFTAMVLLCSMRSGSHTDHISNIPCNLRGLLGD
ncbi:uncharacterized protein LOC141926717 isoform X5 [Strix aluco]|uniref:uncharacterized protein LOC141926717 isoform X5 n=1 Tax=Strix aluco TaxID=111821 RepID=UPI003DA4F52B